MGMSISNLALLQAKQKGYFVTEDGLVVSSKGKFIKLRPYKSGRLAFSFKFNKKKVLLKVHRLVALQKFGDALFIKGIEVRHMDGNCANNSYSNINIGTHSDNQMDVPLEIRTKNAAVASRKLSPHLRESILLDVSNKIPYRALSKKYNISISTISFLVNGKSYNVKGVDY